jgi:hypothetical protein
MGPFYVKKNKDGVDFRYFRKCRHCENILIELGAVDYSRLSIFNCNTTSGYEIAENFRSQRQLSLETNTSGLRRISYPRVCIRHDNSPSKD